MHYLGLNQAYSPAYKLSKLYTLHANTSCSMTHGCRDKHLKAQADSHVVHEDEKKKYLVANDTTANDTTDLNEGNAQKAALDPLNPQMDPVVSCRRSENGICVTSTGLAPFPAYMIYAASVHRRVSGSFHHSSESQFWCCFLKDVTGHREALFPGIPQ